MVQTDPYPEVSARTARFPRVSAPANTFPWLRVGFLALAVFTTVTADMLPAGVLPQIARDFSVGVSTASILMSAWAITIAAASLPLVRLLGHIDRRTVLALSLIVMAAMNVGVAVAPNFGLAVTARILGGAAHGVFWAIVMVYASGISPIRYTGRAVTLASAGSTAGILLGVPAGTAIGQFAGWRWGFGALAVLMFTTALIVRVALPSLPSPTASRGEPASRWDPSMRPVLILGLVQLLVPFAQYTLFTYISPFLTMRAGIAQELVSVLLLVFGGGGLVGLLATAVTTDHWPRASLGVALAVLASSLFVLAAWPASVVAVFATVATWGVALGALPPLLLARTLRVASERTQSLASAIAIVFFNLGVGGGAWLGGLLVDGPGLATTAWAAATLASLALFVALASFSSGGRTLQATAPVR